MHRQHRCHANALPVQCAHGASRVPAQCQGIDITSSVQCQVCGPIPIPGRQIRTFVSHDLRSGHGTAHARSRFDIRVPELTPTSFPMYAFFLRSCEDTKFAPYKIQVLRGGEGSFHRLARHKIIARAHAKTLLRRPTLSEVRRNS